MLSVEVLTVKEGVWEGRRFVQRPPSVIRGDDPLLSARHILVSSCCLANFPRSHSPSSLPAARDWVPGSPSNGPQRPPINQNCRSVCRSEGGKALGRDKHTHAVKQKSGVQREDQLI